MNSLFQVALHLPSEEGQPPALPQSIWSQQFGETAPSPPHNVDRLVPHTEREKLSIDTEAWLDPGLAPSSLWRLSVEAHCVRGERPLCVCGAERGRCGKTDRARKDSQSEKRQPEREGGRVRKKTPARERETIRERETASDRFRARASESESERERETCPSTRWATTRSSKVNLHHASNLRALYGAHLVT